MNKLNLPFDKIYLINLVENKNRLNDMYDQFRYLGIKNDVELFQTCLHPHINVISKSLSNNNCGNFNSPNAFNCTREHYTIIKRAYINNLNSIMIIEDDCQFLNKIDILQNYFDNLPYDWDILRINCLRGSTEEDYFNNKSSLWEKQFIGIWGTGCYALSRKGMKYILDSLDNYYEPIDCPLFNYNKDKNINQYISKIPLGISKLDNNASISSENYTPYNPLYYYFDIKNINLHDYGVNHKTLIYYMSHILNKKILKRYNNIKNSLPKNYDIIFLISQNNKNNNLLESINNYIFYDDSLIFNKNCGGINPGIIIENLYKEHINLNYDFYYLIEYDVIFNGDWKYFFETIEHTCNNADFIGAYIKKKNNFYWEFFINDSFYKTQLKSCISTVRLSNKALKTICKYSEKFNNKTIYEMYWPTICYNNNLIIKSLSPNYNDDEFNCGLNFCNMETYSVFFETYDESNLNEKNILYTRVK